MFTSCAHWPVTLLEVSLPLPRRLTTAHRSDIVYIDVYMHACIYTENLCMYGSIQTLPVCPSGWPQTDCSEIQPWAPALPAFFFKCKNDRKQSAIRLRVHGLTDLRSSHGRLKVQQVFKALTVKTKFTLLPGSGRSGTGFHVAKLS